MPTRRSPKPEHVVKSVEAGMIKVSMLIGLFFSAWLTYHFVKLALVGLVLAMP